MLRWLGTGQNKKIPSLQISAGTGLTYNPAVPPGLTRSRAHFAHTNICRPLFTERQLRLPYSDPRRFCSPSEAHSMPILPPQFHPLRLSVGKTFGIYLRSLNGLLDYITPFCACQYFFRCFSRRFSNRTLTFSCAIPLPPIRAAAVPFPNTAPPPPPAFHFHPAQPSQNARC